MTPTQRSLKALRADGYMAYITERWNPFAKIRQDLFGFIDIVAIKKGCSGVLAIQTTSGSHVAERVKKIQENEAYAVWKASGNRVIVHGWRKVGMKGKRKMWECRGVEL